MLEWKVNVRETIPYVPGEQPQEGNIIKLNTNENPYPPAPKVASMAEQMDTDKFRLYPDPDVGMLTDKLAEYHGVNSNQVFVGVGSDDVLAMAFLTFFNSDKPILFPDITYSFYKVWAGLFKIPYSNPSLNRDFTINIQDYMVPNGGIVITNPNAPTSLYEPLSSIEDIVKANPCSVVIVDEAYIDFGGESALSLIEKYDNVLVVRTFSKSRSMAGMRIGYAVGNEELINALKSVKLSYNSYTMNMPSIILGTESVEDEQYFQSTLAKIVNTRENVKEQLEAIGFSVLESATNFLFATHERVSAESIFNDLRKKGIYVRYFKTPRIDNYIRITIGTDEEMAIFMEEITKLVK
ncbi:MAG: histidinol-phosphate transaminase [Lachnospiraceae bacterium]|nr:histidinol-phosphate transaminase [Lachnospiraceae bacterium]